MKTEACGSGERNCVALGNQIKNYEEHLGEQEVAKRAGRAFMHAALLCGGTQAVSPF